MMGAAVKSRRAEKGGTCSSNAGEAKCIWVLETWPNRAGRTIKAKPMQNKPDAWRLPGVCSRSREAFACPLGAAGTL